jgi:hypothetical protein
MRTTKLLDTAKSVNVAERIQTALDRGWSPKLIAKHGNTVVKRALVAKLGGSTPESAPKRAKSPKAPKPKATADFSKAKDHTLVVNRTPLAGGQSEQVTLIGQRGIVGPKGAVYGLYTTQAKEHVRLSDQAVARLHEGSTKVPFQHPDGTFVWYVLTGA